MPIDKLFGALNTSASGLSAQRRKLDNIASNIANAGTTRTEDGQPYRRKITVMRAKNSEGFRTVLQRKANLLSTSNPRHLKGANFTTSAPGTEATVEAKTVEDKAALKRVYDPDHPDADEEGYVYMPNVDMVSEMVDMINASRGYEANLSAMDAAKKMAKAALDI